MSDSLDAIKTVERANDIIECLDRSAIFFNDVLPQIGRLAIQDYANLNELSMLLTRLRSPEITDETKRYGG